MTEETTVAETNPPKATPKPRAPKLKATYDGAEHPLLKYPFPVKAPRFNVNVNGVTCEAATTGGRGKEYTYILINNTSFYVPGVVPHDAKVAIEFPDDYKFDDAVVERKSYYKPKKAKEGDEGDNPKAESSAEETPAEEPAPSHESDPNPPKATRRKR